MQNHLKVARAVTDLLENKFGVGKLRFGLDPVLGMFPGFGDIITLVISLYLVWIGVKMQIPKEKTSEMISNVVMDFILGLFPILGDFTDAIYRSNSKNMKILESFARSSVSVVEADVVEQ